jgi:hypothetical protein
VVVGLCRLALMATIDAHPAVAMTGVAVITIAWLAFAAGLVWVYWRSRPGAHPAKPFVLALAVSTVAVGVSVEAFAGATTLLWQHDLIAGAPGVTPGLWRTEQYYLWHLVDSIPLLDIPDGASWRQPPLSANRLGGALLLAFKLLLVVPLIRISIDAYLLISGWILEAGRRREDLKQRKVVDPGTRAAFRRARAAVDREERALVADRRRIWSEMRRPFGRAVGHRPRPALPAPTGAAPPAPTGADAEPPAASAWESVLDMIDKLDGVAALFGTGEVLSAADAAAASLRRRLDELGGHMLHSQQDRLAAMREEEERRFEAYRTAAADALRRYGLRG